MDRIQLALEITMCLVNNAWNEADFILDNKKVFSLDELIRVTRYDAQGTKYNLKVDTSNLDVCEITFIISR